MEKLFNSRFITMKFFLTEKLQNIVLRKKENQNHPKLELAGQNIKKKIGTRNWPRKFPSVHFINLTACSWMV